MKIDEGKFIPNPSNDSNFVIDLFIDIRTLNAG